jgi:hypothetical protein
LVRIVKIDIAVLINKVSGRIFSSDVLITGYESQGNVTN